MPLQKQLLEVPLSAGLDQKADIRGLRVDGAVSMQNCVRLKNGAIRKRFGHTALSKTASNPTITAAVNVGTVRGRPWLFDGANLFLYADGDSRWVVTARGCQAQVGDRVVLASTQAQIVDYDVAYSNGYLVYLYQDNLSIDIGGTVRRLWYGIIDVSGGAYPNSQGATADVVFPLAPFFAATPASVTAPKLIACGTTVIATWQEGGATPIRVSKLDTTNPQGGWTAPVTLVSPGGTAQLGAYDVAPVVGDATRFAALYEVAAGSGTVALNIFTVSTLASATIKNFDVNANFNTCTSMGLCARNNGHYWLSYVATAGASIGATPQIRAAFYNENGATTAAPVNVSGTGIGLSVGKMGLDATEAVGAELWYSSGQAAGAAAMGAARLIGYVLQDVAGVVNPLLVAAAFGVQLAGRPFVLNGRVNVPVQTPSSLQGTYYLLDRVDSTASYPLVPVATLAPRLVKSISTPMAVGGSFTLAHVVSVPTAPGATWIFPGLFATSTFHSSLFATPIDLAPLRTAQGQELGGVQALSGATPLFFDGQIAAESAFFTYPELPTPTDGGAGLLSAGTYQYIAHYESRDQQGNISRSGTSPAVSITLAASHQATLTTIPAPPVTKRLGSEISAVNLFTVETIYLALYRTTANGTLFYRVTPDPPTAAWAFPFPPAPLTITDNLSDAALTASATAQLLYTTGGVLDNFTPPAARCAIVHQGRYFLAGCDDPTQVWPSKALTSGEAPGFNEQNNFLATGAVRALASLDDKLVMFVQRGTAYGIEYITGQGPTDLGTQSDWTPPIQVMSDAGAIDQRGTCTGPFGVLFRSPVGGPNASGGIFILTRDLQVKYLSAPVEDALAANPVVTSMIVHPTAGRVYITCVPTDYGFTSGIRLVWDYTNGGVWSIDQMFDADTAQASAGARSAFVANTSASGPTYHWVTSGGRVYRETNGVGASSYTDAGTWVAMKFQGAWLKPAHAGFARFWGVQLQGDSLDPYDLTVQLTFDEAPSSYYQESHTWTALQQSSFDRFPQIDIGMTVGNQKARAIQVTLTDAAPTGVASVTGQGPSWAAISLELGVKEGAYRNLPPGQRA